LRTGCQWRNLPLYYPNWRTSYGYFREWIILRAWDKIHDVFRESCREKSGKQTFPTAAIIDSQSVKTTEQADSKGYDAAKKVTGRKRHIVVDTLGLLLEAEVTVANKTDRSVASTIIGKISDKFKAVVKIFADGSYAGKLVDFVEDAYGVILEIVKRNSKEFKVLPWRWVVEWTFGWLNRSRRLSKDYEVKAKTSEAWIKIAMINLMLRHVVKNPLF
jgi:putative transposase